MACVSSWVPFPPVSTLMLFLCSAASSITTLCEPVRIVKGQVQIVENLCEALTGSSCPSWCQKWVNKNLAVGTQRELIGSLVTLTQFTLRICRSFGKMYIVWCWLCKGRAFFVWLWELILSLWHSQSLKRSNANPHYLKSKHINSPFSHIPAWLPSSLPLSPSLPPSLRVTRGFKWELAFLTFYLFVHGCLLNNFCMP